MTTSQNCKSMMYVGVVHYVHTIVTKLRPSITALEQLELELFCGKITNHQKAGDNVNITPTFSLRNNLPPSADMCRDRKKFIAA